MRLKKRLILMKPKELRDYQDVWLKRIQKFHQETWPSSLGWKWCSWRIRLIQEEIVFKDWILDGLKKMNRDKMKR